MKIESTRVDSIDGELMTWCYEACRRVILK